MIGEDARRCSCRCHADGDEDCRACCALVAQRERDQLASLLAAKEAEVGELTREVQALRSTSALGLRHEERLMLENGDLRGERDAARAEVGRMAERLQMAPCVTCGQFLCHEGQPYCWQCLTSDLAALREYVAKQKCERYYCDVAPNGFCRTHQSECEVHAHLMPDGHCACRTCPTRACGTCPPCRERARKGGA